MNNQRIRTARESYSADIRRRPCRCCLTIDSTSTSLLFTNQGNSARRQKRRAINRPSWFSPVFFNCGQSHVDRLTVRQWFPWLQNIRLIQAASSSCLIVPLLATVQRT